MSTPYLGQIQPFPYNFAPRGWAVCNGQTLPISQYAALFSLIGTFYGGNGINNFQLPNLQGRCALSFGTAPSGTPYVIGQLAGEANHTLLLTELPAHVHTPPTCSTATGTAVTPVNTFPASLTKAPYFPSTPTSLVSLGNGTASTGGSTPHANQSPYLVLNFCIALNGIFPSRN
ncbi:phage tail protein [Granulicella sp. S156]|jgi:microcystin-dependent protein|uniref:phage tail protein n=1 Tax=Granulicella sp. S156 TaxID=1747224 RepID=UPI00131B6EB7|nr:tail fiber protein [Granulicella sp. S156]